MALTTSADWDTTWDPDVRREIERRRRATP
jgi:hypothetical protein